MFMEEHTLTLAHLPAGQKATLLSLRGGFHLRSRLSSLGFTPGVEVLMTQNYHHGPLIVTVRGTRVALGRGEAMHILVQKEAA